MLGSGFETLDTVSVAGLKLSCFSDSPCHLWKGRGLCGHMRPGPSENQAVLKLATSPLITFPCIIFLVIKLEFFRGVFNVCIYISCFVTDSVVYVLAMITTKQYL